MQQSFSDPKSWRKWLFVLKKVKSSGTASLEYYKEVKKETTKQNPKGVLNLLSNYSVQIVGSASMRKFVFEVRTLEQTFRLAAETRELMDEWVYFMQGQTQASHVVSPSESNDVLLGTGIQMMPYFSNFLISLESTKKNLRDLYDNALPAIVTCGLQRSCN